MTTPPEHETFARLVQRIAPESTLRRAWDLTGGVSAQVTAIEVEQPDGQTRKMVVRRHGEADLKDNPNIAADEFKLLRLLTSAGIPAPAPYHVDQSGAIFPTPCIVIEYIEGETEFAPADVDDFLLQIAATLASIHRIDLSAVDVSFLSEIEERCAKMLRERPARLDDSLDEGRIRDTLETVWPPPQRNNSVLLHGDYWPGNLLWREGQLAAVIDWEDAALGDPLADLANTRLELLWTFGIDAMHRFTHQYQAMTAIDATDQPYWDLCAALRPAHKIAEWAGGDHAKERLMREAHRLFVTQACEQLDRRAWGQSRPAAKGLD